jgi:hypothetical protein
VKVRAIEEETMSTWWDAGKELQERNIPVWKLIFQTWKVVRAQWE